jgi:hypothetical protein
MPRIRPEERPHSWGPVPRPLALSSHFEPERRVFTTMIRAHPSNSKYRRPHAPPAFRCHQGDAATRPSTPVEMKRRAAQVGHPSIQIGGTVTHDLHQIALPTTYLCPPPSPPTFWTTRGGLRSRLLHTGNILPSTQPATSRKPNQDAGDCLASMDSLGRQVNP